MNQTSQGAWQGLGTQSLYEAPGDPQVEYDKPQWLKLGKWVYPLDNCAKLAVEQPNWIKNYICI